MKKIITATLLTFFTAWASASQGAWALFDYADSKYQISYNKEEVRSIASITKLFTAITVLRSGADLNEYIKVSGTASGKISNGSQVRRIDLLKAMLIASDNRSAESLANAHPGGFEKFLEDTNDWIKREQLHNTQIVDSTGLKSGNVSTIDDIIRLISISKNYPEINHNSALKETEVESFRGKKSIRIKVRNTNPSVHNHDNILVSKTGFTNAAGRCVAMLVEKGQNFYAVVILGQKNSKIRTEIASELISSAPIRYLLSQTQ